MFCPACKAEYREGYTHCRECSVDLVSTLEPAADRQLVNDPPVVVWRGQDPVAFSAVVSALASAHITYLEFHNRDFTACLSRPLSLAYYGVAHSEVRVYAPDLEAAREIVSAVLRPIVAVPGDEEEPERVSPVSHDASAGDAAPVEVWRGDDAQQAGALRQALFAAQIGSWLLSSTSGHRILVSRRSVRRAKQIVCARADSHQPRAAG
jgi:hypothetical protein